MKTLFLKSKFVLLILSFLVFASCSSDDENSPTVQPPTLSYATTTLDATFFQVGNSATPTLNWNGNQGNFSLATPVTGLNVNTTTGVLNWTKDLPIGSHNLEIVVTNSAGQTSVNLTLNNPLQGVFRGVYDSSLFFELEFNTDGTLLLRAGDEINPDEATGIWTKNGATIEIDYTYNNTGGEFSLSGTLATGTSAIYSGDWFFNFGTISGNEGGDFEVILN